MIEQGPPAGSDGQPGGHCSFQDFFGKGLTPAPDRVVFSLSARTQEVDRERVTNMRGSRNCSPATDLSDSYVRPGKPEFVGLGYTPGQPQTKTGITGQQLTFNELADEALQDLAHGKIDRPQYVAAIEKYRGVTGVQETRALIV